jgi:hypothetical protein
VTIASRRQVAPPRRQRRRSTLLIRAPWPIFLSFNFNANTIFFSSIYQLDNVLPPDRVWTLVPATCCSKDLVTVCVPVSRLWVVEVFISRWFLELRGCFCCSRGRGSKEGESLKLRPATLARWIELICGLVLLNVLTLTAWRCLGCQGCAPIDLVHEPNKMASDLWREELSCKPEKRRKRRCQVKATTDALVPSLTCHEPRINNILN